MNIILKLYGVIDSILMPFIRFFDEPVAGFFLGTFLLACTSVLIGECSIAVAYRFNREKIDDQNREMDYYQTLSLKALKAGNKAVYKACNSIANNAYGKNFFSQAALSASSLWPAFIALGWMQYRFSLVEFSLPYPLSGYSPGYGAAFLACYIPARLLTRLVKGRMYAFKRFRFFTR